MPEPTLPTHDSFKVIPVPRDASFVVIQTNTIGEPNLVFVGDQHELSNVFKAFDFGYELGRQS